jgi:hypothetical protein
LFIFSYLILFISIEDSQGNINPYAVTGYTTNYKDENDNKHNHRLLDSTGMIQ